MIHRSVLQKGKWIHISNILKMVLESKVLPSNGRCQRGLAGHPIRMVQDRMVMRVCMVTQVLTFSVVCFPCLQIIEQKSQETACDFVCVLF